MGSIPKKITVFGATGNQGGAVCRSLIANPDFQVRAITRKPDSEASKKLSSLGVEIFKGDGWNVKDMVEAFTGSWGAFINTNSFEPQFLASGRLSEFDQGKIIVDSAIAAGIQHVVYSTGASCTELTQGKLQVDAYDKKYDTEQYIRSSGKFNTTAFIGAGWFLENFLYKEEAQLFGGFPYTPDAEGYLTYRVPYYGGNGLVPWVDIANDFGDMVHGVFLQPERWNGHVIHGISEQCTQDDLCRTFEKVTGKKARFIPILPSYESFDTFGLPDFEIVKSLMGLTQLAGGRCFGLEENESKTAAELKQAVAEALGRSDASLMTVARWFQENFTY